MEIILYTFVAFIGIIGLFLIIEYPYHFIGLYIFIVHYRFNIDLPGPLDLRGLIAIILFFRLIVFDKENLDMIIKHLFKNYLFILILLFEIYFIAISYYTTLTYKIPIRLFIFQMIGLVLGFLAVYRGYAMKTVFIAVIGAGIIGTVDLVYSFGITSQLFVRRVLDVFIKSEFATDLNHNFFGVLNGFAFVIVYILMLAKQLNKKLSVFLLIVFGSGILLSTSRGVLLAVFIAIILATIMLPKEHIDVKKILSLAIKGFVLVIIIIGSYLIIMSNLNVNSTFSDKVYYRLVEEPMALISGKTSAYRGTSKNLKEGSASWRIKKAFRDFNEFSKLPFFNQLTGFGYKGYFKVGEKEFDHWNQRIQISSHNGLATIIIERGIIGFVFFFIFNIFLIKKSVSIFKKDITMFPFFIMVIFMFVYTFFAGVLLLDRFGYILMGGIMGQDILYSHTSSDDQN